MAKKNVAEEAAQLMALGAAVRDVVQASGMLVAPRKRGRVVKRRRRPKADTAEAAPRKRPAKKKAKPAPEKKRVHADVEEPQ